MPRELSTFPTLPDTVQTVSLGPSVYRLRLRWFDRLAAWYLDVHAQDGTPITMGHRVSPGWGVQAGLTLPAFPGFLVFQGLRDPYTQDDLGRTVQLIYVTPDELDAARAATATPRPYIVTPGG